MQWKLKTRTMPLGERPLLMGIVNITPDSFSDGGNFLTPQSALTQALKLLDDGADLLDLGGESTRPNAHPISAEEEQSRVLPVLEAILKARPETVVSVDTYHSQTAAAAIASGAEIINDVSGLQWDPAMAETLARLQPGAILMHTRGRPSEWRTFPPLAPDEVMPLVLNGLRQTLAQAAAAGIRPEAIVLDPGFGFGKLGPDNFILLNHLAELHQLGYPILAGLSRKRFLTEHLTNPTPAQILQATTAAHLTCHRAGAHILRIHEIPATLRAAIDTRAAHSLHGVAPVRR
jgi:dihydropteroate synthase